MSERKRTQFIAGMLALWDTDRDAYNRIEKFCQEAAARSRADRAARAVLKAAEAADAASRFADGTSPGIRISVDNATANLDEFADSVASVAMAAACAGASAELRGESGEEAFNAASKAAAAAQEIRRSNDRSIGPIDYLSVRPN